MTHKCMVTKSVHKTKGLTKLHIFKISLLLSKNTFESTLLVSMYFVFTISGRVILHQ